MKTSTGKWQFPLNTSISAQQGDDSKSSIEIYYVIAKFPLFQFRVGAESIRCRCRSDSQWLLFLDRLQKSTDGYHSDAVPQPHIGPPVSGPPRASLSVGFWSGAAVAFRGPLPAPPQDQLTFAGSFLLWIDQPKSQKNYYSDNIPSKRRRHGCGC